MRGTPILPSLRSALARAGHHPRSTKSAPPLPRYAALPAPLTRPGPARCARPVFKADERIAPLEDMAAAEKNGTFQVFEGYAIHRELLEKRGQDYDPIARSRLELGRNRPAADYIALTRERTRLVPVMDAWLEDIDAVVLPPQKESHLKYPK